MTEKIVAPIEMLYAESILAYLSSGLSQAPSGVRMGSRRLSRRPRGFYAAVLRMDFSAMAPRTSTAATIAAHRTAG